MQRIIVATILLFIHINAQALVIHQNSLEETVGIDAKLNLYFKISTITYGHSHLEINWGVARDRTFRIVFIAKTLQSLPLDPKDFMVQVGNDEHHPASDLDRMTFLNLAHLLLLKPDFPEKYAVIEILNQLGQMSYSTYLYPPERLCENRSEWVYGSYNFLDDTRIVLAPVGNIATSCYGKCGSQCSDTTGRYAMSCLNHDLCHRIEGSQLGECTDEFIDAGIATMTTEPCN